MPTDVKKVSDEELAGLRGLQDQFDILTKKLGELHFQKKMIDRELVSVDSELDVLEANRVATVTRLQTEFGSTGTINLATGEFVPD